MFLSFMNDGLNPLSLCIALRPSAMFSAYLHRINGLFTEQEGSVHVCG